MTIVKKNTSALEDYKVNLKIKLSALWISVMFCYLYGDYFELYIPKQIEIIISGNSLLNTPQLLFAASILMAIPALMVFLSITLKPKLNRFLNIIFGTLFTAIMILIAINSITLWRTFYVFLAIVESCLTSLIVWYAWKWSKQTQLNQ